MPSNGRADIRQEWIDVLLRIASPVLAHAAGRTLRAAMPVECQPGSGREAFSHLEAVGRTMAGIAPWLATDEPASRELATWARQAIDATTDPASPDYCNWDRQNQPLVDAAFLVQGILRAPDILWQPLEPRVKRQLVAALRMTRVIKPGPNNWLLFSAMVEAGLLAFGLSDWDALRIDYALRQTDKWYKGDGVYGDGESFHWDYYNAFVIQPMLLDILHQVGDRHGWHKLLYDKVRTRARRYAAIQKRLISPEGTFPPLGRSLAYRFGALQSLAQAALEHDLPQEIAQSQVREAMTAVIRRSMNAPGTFNAQGWLTIGFCGHQPDIGEAYISTGSLYLCTAGLLPLGLPPADPFWSDPARPWSSVLAWTGQAIAIDHAISEL